MFLCFIDRSHTKTTLVKWGRVEERDGGAVSSAASAVKTATSTVANRAASGLRRLSLRARGATLRTGNGSSGSGRHSGGDLDDDDGLDRDFMDDELDFRLQQHEPT